MQNKLLVTIFLLIICFSSIAQIVADTFNVPSYPIPEIYFTDEAPELPDNAWNHKLENFPQFYYNQHDLPNCGQASGHFNCMTYEFNRLYKRAADSSNIFSPTHIFNFLNGGNGWYGVSTFDSWNVVKSQGNMVLSDFYELPYIPDEEKSEKYRGQNWANGYEKYYKGMRNRISDYYSLNTSTDDDLKILMHYFNDHLEQSDIGGVAIFYANPGYYHNYYNEIVDTICPETNGVFNDSSTVVVEMYGDPTHSMTLAGYYKNTSVDFNNDGIISDTIDINGDGIIDMHDNETIFWIVINSWGNYWRNSHFLYKYDMLTKIWNKQVFLPIPDTAYKPELTFKIKLKHPYRENIKISAGISADLESEYPEQTIDFPIWNYQGSDHGMTGVDTLSNSETLEFGVNITEVKKLKNGSGPYNIYLKINNSGIHVGELQYFSIIDYSKNNPVEYVVVDTPIIILPTVENFFKKTLEIESVKSDSIIEIASPTSIIGKPMEKLTISLTPVDGHEPYQFHIIQKDEYSVALSNIDYNTSTAYVSLNSSIVHTSNPKIITPGWRINFNGKTYDSIAIEQSGTIAIDTIVKFNASYPYQSLRKNSKYLQMNAYNTSEYSRETTFIRYRIRDTAIAIIKQKCTFDEWDGFDCIREYLTVIYPSGKVSYIYPEETPQDKIFPNIKTHTNTYCITHEQATTNTYNAVTFTPNIVDSLFTINENGELTMQAVSEPGKYETYVLIRDANGQEFTKRIVVTVINENIIGNLYPNPTKDILYCDIYNPIQQNTNIEIFTITGQCIYKESTLHPSGITEHNISTSKFVNGVYLLKITMGEKSQTQRFVVMR